MDSYRDVLLIVANVINVVYTFEQLKPHKVRFKFKGNVADKSIKTHTKCANLNVHRCIIFPK